MTSADFSELERTLAQARRKLAALRERRPAQAPQPAAGGAADGAGAARNQQTGAQQGHGSAAEGRIRAVAAGGRVASLTLDPLVLRATPEALALDVQTAINAALDAAGAPAAGDVIPGIDLGVLATQLAHVTEEGLRQLYRITSALQDAVAKIRSDADMPGTAAMPDLEGLLADTRRTLAAAAAAPRPDGEVNDAAVTGEGEAGPGALVRASAAPGGRVVSLSIAPAAARKGSADLAGYVVAAVNAALAGAAELREEAAAAAAADRAALADRVRAVQDLSVQQMRAFGSMLADLMTSANRRLG